MPRRPLTTLFAAASLYGSLLFVSASAVSAAVLPPGNPPDSQPSAALAHACYPPGNPGGCNAAALADINAARSREGLGPMTLPTNYNSLPASDQLFVLINLERVDRGLAPLTGVTTALNQDAMSGAAAGTDPPAPAGSSASASLWIGGYATPLFDDFYWMYDDGPGGVSTSCCWAHRDAILRTWSGSPANVLMGAAVTASGSWPDSTAVVIASGVAQSPVFTWNAEYPFLTYLAAPGSVDLGTAPGTEVSSGILLIPSGRSATFTASVAGGSGQWGVYPSTCSVAPAGTCHFSVTFAPRQGGSIDAVLLVTGPGANHSIPLYGGPFNGYWLGASDGGIFSFGTAEFAGSAGGLPLVRPVVGIAATTDNHGYWSVASDGGVFSYGDAHFYGSTGGIPLNRPVVGMAANPHPGGYWLVASDGGVFSFGSSRFYGSTGGIRLNRPVVGMAAYPYGSGYWMVASDGGVFSFGASHFHGSTGGMRLVAPIVGMASTADGRGYWLVAADGGIFSFGDARFFGSAAGITHTPIVGMTVAPGGGGYWLAGADGSVFSFGAAPFHGAQAGLPLGAPVVGIAG